MDYSEGPDQRCDRPGVLTIGSKDIVLEYTVPKARCDDPEEAPRAVTGRALYASPADALWRGTISDLAENAFVRYSVRMSLNNG